MNPVNSLQVTAAIIRKDNKVFIARRAANKHLSGFWEFPGGKIEEGESPEVCLKREIEEELGININVGEFFMENVHDYGELKIILKSYCCELVSGEISLHDHDQFRWVTHDELQNYNFAPADIPFIMALKNGK